MNRIFSVINVIFIITYTTFSTICNGIPLQELIRVGDNMPREIRGALRNRICPSGISRESCFFSQLSMFIRLQDSLVDTVNMRTIGKRNGYIRDSRPKISDLVENPSLVQPFGIGDEEDEYIKQLGRTYSNMLLEGDSLQKQQLLLRLSDYVDTLRALDESDKGTIATQSNNNRQSWGLKEPKRNLDYLNSLKWKRDNENFSVPKKRQIICPYSMSRVECYDNALSFYLRLLRSVSDH